MESSPNISEEKEQWALDREAQAGALEENMKVHRVVGQRDDQDGTEYLVKCKSTIVTYQTLPSHFCRAWS